MPYALRYDVPADEHMYRRVKARIGDDQPDGLIAHLVVQSEVGLRHIGVWDSEADWQRFHDVRVEPAVQAVLSAAGFTEMPPDPPVEELKLVDISVGRRANAGTVRSPTHAMVATFHLDLSREAEQQEGLNRIIVPSVRSSPGFVAGCWTLDRATSESVAMITFDSMEAAQALADTVRGSSRRQSAVGIKLLSIRVLEVSASA